MEDPIFNKKQFMTMVNRVNEMDTKVERIYRTLGLNLLEKEDVTEEKLKNINEALSKQIDPINGKMRHVKR